MSSGKIRKLKTLLTSNIGCGCDPKATDIVEPKPKSHSSDNSSKTKKSIATEDEDEEEEEEEDRSKEEESSEELMGDYHFIYKDVEGASTQWDDIQRKLGNLPPKPPAFKPAPFSPLDDDPPKDKSWIDHKTQEELEDLEDDLDDDRFLQDYRKKRLAEMREAAKIARFGSIIPISGSDFVREVSQAPQDIWIVVLLYKDGYPQCSLLLQCLEDLAKRYPATKFVKIISTECIPNYPDRNLPTVLVYNNSAVKATHVGIHSFGRRCTPESVGLVLCQSDPVLNDGHGGEQSREAVLDGVRKKFVERVVREHEDDDDGSSSD